MENQDWTQVVMRRRFTKTEAIQRGLTTIQARDPLKNEKQRLVKIDNDDAPVIKKRVNAESIQALIRKRIEMKLTQEKTDILCSFPKHTFKNLEAHRLLPSEEQKRKIQQYIGVQLKIDTVSSN
jgi:hypothetical protein